MKTYKEFRPSGPRELTAEMVQSINDADKPPARGKKPDKGKLKKQAQGAKGPSPKKRKPSKTDQTPPPTETEEKPAKEETNSRFFLKRFRG